MVPKIFHISKTAKTDCNVTNIREIYRCIEVSMHFFIVFNIPIHYYRIGGNKNRDFQFFSQFAK